MIFILYFIGMIHDSKFKLQNRFKSLMANAQVQNIAMEIPSAVALRCINLRSKSAQLRSVSKGFALVCAHDP